MSQKKPFLPKAEYFRLEDELKKLLDDTTFFEPSILSQIKGELAENVIYIDAYQMIRFDKFVDKLKRYKFINYGRAACELNYTQKHKYFLTKNPPKVQFTAALQKQIHELNKTIVQTKNEIDEDDSENDALVNYFEDNIKKKAEYQDILTNIDSYELAISNYYKFYYYTTLNYRYYNEEQECFESKSEHIVKNIYNKNNELLTEKFNIVFIDTDRIERKNPHQHKEVEKYLDSFDLVIRDRLFDFYLKKR